MFNWQRRITIQAYENDKYYFVVETDKAWNFDFFLRRMDQFGPANYEVDLYRVKTESSLVSYVYYNPKDKEKVEGCLMMTKMLTT